MNELCGHATNAGRLARLKKPGPPCRNPVAFGSTRCAAGHRIDPARWHARAASIFQEEDITEPTLNLDELYGSSETDWAQPHDAIRRLRERLLDLEDSEEWGRYLETQAKFHNYSSNNSALIIEQCPHATVVANEKTWNELGRVVKSDVTPIYIWKPMFEGPLGDESRSRRYSLNELRPGFTTTPVFDISQTDGEPLSYAGLQMLKGGAPRGSFTGLVSVAKEFGFTVYNHNFGNSGPNGVNGETHRFSQSILLSESISDAQRVKTLAHELGHVLLHGPDADEFFDRAKAELEAESVAFVVCNALGLSTDKYSAPYAAIWSGGGKNAIDEISASLSRIKRASHRILATYGRVNGTPPQDEREA